MGANIYLVYSVLGGVGLICMVAIPWGLWLGQRDRSLTHIERMKALELVRGWPDDEATARLDAAFGRSSGSLRSLAHKCFSTALWVAFWGFGAAASAAGASTAVAYVIAVSVGAIGVTAMICGTVLAVRVPASAARGLAPKPAASEADDFDLVACRG